jgi:ribosomal protein L33
MNKVERLLDILSDSKPHCHKDLNIEIDSDQLAKVRQIARDEYGAIFREDETGTKFCFKQYCSDCKEKTWHSQLLSFDEDGIKSKDIVSKKVRERAKKLIPYVDAFTGLPRNKLQLDHKDGRESNYVTPLADDCTDEAIINRYQWLSPSANTMKREACTKICKSTGIRQWIIAPIFTSGTEKYEETCIGCPHYDYRDWVNKVIAK